MKDNQIVEEQIIEHDPQPEKNQKIRSLMEKLHLPTDKDEFITKLPHATTTMLVLLASWLSVRALFNYIFLMAGQFREEIPMFVLFGSPLKPSMLGFVITFIVTAAAWQVSTKDPYFQTARWRIVTFFQMFIGIAAYYTWMVTAPIYNSLVPFFLGRFAQVEIENVWHEVLIGNTQNQMIILVFVPTIIMLLLMLWLGGVYAQDNIGLKQAFFAYEFQSKRLQKFFMLGKIDYWPDVVLGPDSDSKELVIQTGRDRTLNNIIIGSIGTGKTSALVLPILNQDLHWMTRFINDFKGIHKKDDYETEDVKGMYLNGISVIEPSNDLCQKALQLVKAHGIPEESVFYIDPTNPETPCINPMQGPAEQVAEAFAMVIEGLGEGGASGNFFFQQSERNHLKHYILLLKFHEPNNEVIFDMLLDMYNNSQVVRSMHLKLKETYPDNLDTIEDRDERNHWKLVKQVDEWFDENLIPKLSHQGAPEIIKEGIYRGDVAYYDAKAEYVQGLRNILNDIGANKLIRRVLFGESDFDFDKHLEYGGVLLVNTAKGELGGLANVLGKLVLLSLQNAVFRRKPNTSNFHHILVDEFPDYIYQPFKEFPAQSRKYKTIVTVVAQTVAQLADKYGEPYMNTLLGTLRHKMVYGDIPDYDAQLFSKIFGEEERFDETQSEQTVSPLQEMPVMRSGSSFTKAKEAILTPNDIIFQKQFQAAVKLTKNNLPTSVRQIDANFVPKDEFKVAVELVEPEMGAYWLEERNKSLNKPSFVIDAPVEESPLPSDKADVEEEIIEPLPNDLRIGQNGRKMVYDLDLDMEKDKPMKRIRLSKQVETDVVEVNFLEMTQQAEHEVAAATVEVKTEEKESAVEDVNTQELNEPTSSESGPKEKITLKVSQFEEPQEKMMSHLYKTVDQLEASKNGAESKTKNEANRNTSQEKETENEQLDNDQNNVEDFFDPY